MDVRTVRLQGQAAGEVVACVSVVHGSASEFWKVLEQFELFSLTVSQA